MALSGKLSLSTITPKMGPRKPSAGSQLTIVEFRCIQRIGRRGLASACVEEILASSARYVAVMDADLQHDERLLPRMLNVLMTEPIDVVVGSRYVEDGSIGTWDWYRAWLSNFATLLGRRLLGITIADPMSGFFIVRREAFQSWRDGCRISDSRSYLIFSRRHPSR